MIISSNSLTYQSHQNLPKKTNFKADEKVESSFDSDNSYNIKTAGVHMSISQRALELYSDYISKVDQPLARF